MPITNSQPAWTHATTVANCLTCTIDHSCLEHTCPDCAQKFTEPGHGLEFGPACPAPAEA